MPELPEVEVVKRSLEKKLINLIIKKVKINDGNLRYKINRVETSNLEGKKIRSIKRRSKFLILKVGKETILLIHLGMTGKFFFVDNQERKFKTSFYYNIKKKDKKHDRIIFFLQGNQKLIYNDIRKFGFIKLYNIKNFNKITHLQNLGPEPLNSGFNLRYFQKYISGRKRKIKDILMDQKFVSGLGNIYVNEILFLSKIKPTRKVAKVKDTEIEKIIKITKNILRSSIKYGGSSIKDFSVDDGKKGNFQQYFNVYGRKGEKCSNVDCNKNVIRTVISNRATFFCKSCQK